MKLQNYVLGKSNFIERDGITYKLCTKCLEYKPMTVEYFPERSNVKYGFDSHCKEYNHVNMMRSNLSDEELLMFCKNILDNANK